MMNSLCNGVHSSAATNHTTILAKNTNHTTK